MLYVWFSLAWHGLVVKSNTLEPGLLYLCLVWFGFSWYRVARTAQYNLGWLYITQVQSIVQYNVLQCIKVNTIESNSIGCGTAPGHLVAKYYHCEYEAGVFAHPVVTSQIATSVSIVTNMTSWLPCSRWTWARLLKPRARAVSLINSPDQMCLMAGTLWCSAWLSLLPLSYCYLTRSLV